MRILHVIPQFPFFPPNTVIGGHASCVHALANQQSAEGSEVTILSSGQTKPTSLETGTKLVQLPVHAKRGTRRFAALLAASLIPYIKSRQHSFEIIHWHSGFADYAALSALTRAATGTPTLHTFYCPAPSLSPYSAKRHILQLVASRIDRLGAMSENVARSFSALGIPTPSIYGACINIARLQHPTPSTITRKALNLPDNAFVFLFVGNTKPEKNLHTTLLAFDRLTTELPNAHLVITTELDAEPHPALREAWMRIQATPTSKKVRTIGITNEMPNLLHSADAVLTPFSHTHGPSDYFIAALEGLALGKIVISSNIGGMPEVMDDTVGKLVAPNRINELYTAMRDAATDTNLKQTAKRNGPRVTTARFSPRHVSTRYLETYKEILT